MPFNDIEKQSLLAQKGIGPTVLKRLTEMGLDNVAILAKTDPDSFYNVARKSPAQLAGVTAPKRAKRLKLR